jgi:PAS domain S-box-containing protein
LALETPRNITEFESRIALLEKELSAARERISILNSEILKANEVWTGQWELDLTTRETFWDVGFYRLLGVAESIAPDMRLFRNKLGPYCIDKLNGAMNKVLVTKKEYSFEHYLINEAGANMDVRSDLRPVLNDQGDLLKLTGKLTDISTIKNASRELEKLSLIAANTSNAVAMLDKQAKVEWINSSFTSMTGYRQEEIYGRDYRLLHQETSERTFSAEWFIDGLRSSNEVKTEAAIFTKKGKKLWAVLNISPILDYGLNPQGYIVIITDITELKETQHQLAQKNREVTDSINYARRIQEGVLPSDRLIRELLSESFVLYLPKDIIAGDFYWIEVSGDCVLFAAADCTGHGVPGAMVSVVCNNALHRSVREFGLTDPGKILDKTRELVIETFEKSDRNVQDGMDISFCSWNKVTGEFLFAGANNGLYVVRKNELIEFSGCKQPIGKFNNAKPFNTTRIDLKSGDMIYSYTDGYADQFGGSGARSKKFKYQQLKEILCQISEQGPDAQRQVLLDKHLEWKGSVDQIDDICIIGVRIP